MPIIIFAGDHGIVAQGVSAYPQPVTIAMMANFASGGAAISVLARELGSSLEVVDAGTLALEEMAGIVTDKPRNGTRDFSMEAALEPAELAFAFEAGQRAVVRAGATQPDLLIFGEMGIGNTTASAAIAAGLLRVSAEEIAGTGTGVDAAGRVHKARVIDAAIARHSVADKSPEKFFAPLAVLKSQRSAVRSSRRAAPHSGADRRLYRIRRGAGRGAPESGVPTVPAAVAPVCGAGASVGAARAERSAAHQP